MQDSNKILQCLPNIKLAQKSSFLCHYFIVMLSPIYTRRNLLAEASYSVTTYALCHFFKLKLTQYPAYLFSLIPPERQISYDLRNPQAYAQNRARTDRFSNSYFHNTLHEWNKLPTEIRASKTIAEFKRKLIALMRPVRNTIYGVSDLKGIRNITKLRVQFSDLNAHKFHHNFECLRPIYDCGAANEDNEHYLLHCPRFNQLREDLFGTVTEVSGIDIANLDSETLCNLLLYGSPYMTTG